MGQRDMDKPNHPHKTVGDVPIRRSPRIQNQAKPNPGLLAAKKNAMQKMGNKKQTATFSFVHDIYQTARESKGMAQLPTGVVFDEKMCEHECLWDRNYPECPERLSGVIQRCGALGLLSRCLRIDATVASEAQLASLHKHEQVELLKSTHKYTDEEYLETLSSKYDAIFIHPSSWECALLAAGSAIQLVDEICNGKVQNGMALVRPPGHHAMRGEYCGYCFFNNVALAAEHALSKGLKRILIVDWDVHHGQGTQQMFYNDPRVVYFSFHRYEHGSFWPNLRESDFDYIGEGPGRGFNFNIPLNQTGMTDADYLAVFHDVLLQMAYEFDPELILISAGYDAALGCPEGEMELTPAVYAHFISSLMGLANGKLAVVLEGGYCIKSLAEGAAMTLRALLGDPCPNIGSVGPPSPSMLETILNIIYAQRQYWKCFRNYLDVYSIHEPPSESEKRHLPVIRYEFNEPIPEKYATRNCYPVQNLDFRRRISAQLDSLIKGANLFIPPHKVSFVYDPRMMEHKNYEDRDHIEKPSRIFSIHKMHEEFGLLKRLHILTGRYATDEELLYAHSKNHLKQVKDFKEMSPKELIKMKDAFHSVYFHQESYQAARLAAGCLLQVVDSVMTGESSNGVAVIRPPGHHADIDDPCGFCIFNSVSVAAMYAMKQYNLQRILIVDWDVHHGNGTQEIFLEDPRVLYISVHRFDNGDFFPHTGDGAALHVGRLEGTGFNVNIPWNKSNMSNGDYVAAFYRVILPIAYQFNPELVLVSAGFDAAEGDPLGGCKVTPEAFGHFTNWLKPLANGRIILSLEGGYNINSISYSMTMCTKALLGDPIPSLGPGLVPCESAVESINETISYHAQYWSTLCLNQSIPAEDVLTSSKKIKPANGKIVTPEGNNNNINNSSKNVQTLICEGQLLRGLSLSEAKAVGQLSFPRFGRIMASKQPEDANEEAKRSGDEGGGGPPEPSTSQGNVASSAEKAPTLTDFLCDNIQALVNEEMFAVVPLRSCPHLPQIRPIPDNGIDTNATCESCTQPNENWTCLVCYTTQCGRYVNEHMLQHHLETEHPLTLSFSDLSVWCYPCQAYIDNQALYNAKNAAHISKFGSQLTWSYQRKE
uniref:Protein deacetylase HDAC6 n=2 Tax=Lygus hesperus TaxID=30085 RepID=A0A146M156_LYGHE